MNKNMKTIRLRIFHLYILLILQLGIDNLND